jgi:3-oxoacyl-[acyl-carrier protein] reductase
MVLKDKVAIVTGSSRGIGAATAELLAENGAKVVVNYNQNKEQGEKVLKNIQAKDGTAILVQADVTNLEQVEAMVQQTEEKLGPVDILVNNANMHFSIEPFESHKWEDFRNKIVNEMKASFFSCQAVVPSMIKRGGGCIINVSSGLSRNPGIGFIAHTSAKAALDGFSKSLALELGPHGIRVNVVSPGLTETDATAHRPEEMKKAVVAHTPLMRVGYPEDIAGAILFYCTDWAKFVTGSYLPVSGGMMML